MNKKLGLTTVIVLVLFLLSACSGGNITDENLDQQENADAVATASIVKEEEAFRNAISSSGEWIIATLNDLTFEEDIVGEGNIYFASEEYQESAEITEDSEVTGEIEVQK